MIVSGTPQLSTEISRRGLIAGAVVAAGLAATASPVFAQDATATTAPGTGPADPATDPFRYVRPEYQTTVPGESVEADRVDRPVAPGIVLTSFDTFGRTGWTRVHVLNADLTNEYVGVDLLADKVTGGGDGLRDRHHQRLRPAVPAAIPGQCQLERRSRAGGREFGGRRDGGPQAAGDAGGPGPDRGHAARGPRRHGYHHGRRRRPEHVGNRQPHGLSGEASDTRAALEFGGYSAGTAAIADRDEQAAWQQYVGRGGAGRRRVRHVAGVDLVDARRVTDVSRS
jgi:hypothetical protein